MLTIPTSPYPWDILNNPQMYIYIMPGSGPSQLPYGINFGLSLSLRDYLFKTASICHSGRDIELPDSEQFPRTFIRQNLHGLGLSAKQEDEQ